MKTTRTIYSAIRTPDGTLLESNSVHDFKMYDDTITGKTYGIDGGHEYCHYIGDVFDDCTIITLMTDSPFEDIRQLFKWGSYGKDGKSPLKRISLCDMTNDHINNILITLTQLSEEIKDIFRKELKFRKEHKIIIEDID